MPQTVKADPVAKPRPVYLSPKTPLDSARTFRNSLRTAQKLHTLHYYAGDFYRWEGAAYRQLEAEEIRRMVYQFAENAVDLSTDKERSFQPNKSRVDQIIDALRSESLIPTSIPMPAWLDNRAADPQECLPCLNGIVDLPRFARGDRGFMVPPTPLFFSTCALPFKFQPHAPQPTRWLKFIGEVFGSDEEAIACLQEWMGYTLTPDTKRQKMLLLYGPKRSGKGTIASVLTSLVGAQAVANPTLGSLTTNFGLWPLVGKNLAIIGDARLSGRTDIAVITERLLSISGEDRLTIDRKNQKAVEVRLTARVMLLTNELPKLTDASGALASRFMVLSLTQSFFGREDIHLKDSLRSELAGIAAWAVEGWCRLKENGQFTIPQSSDDAVQELEEIGSPILAFVRECCTVGAGRTITTDEIYQRWKEWCVSQGRDNPGTVQVFGRDLCAAVPGVARTRPRFNGERVRCYEGISIGMEPDRSARVRSQLHSEEMF